MLSVGVIGGSGGDGRSAGYYTASVARGRDDYYTGKGEAPGEWFGAGSEALGLAGEIDATQFQKVVMGAVDPVSGERLRRRARDRPVHGVDMTFSAPKSVSLVYFLGGERARAAVRQAHDEAVMAGLGYMERQACVVREGRAGSKGRQVAEGFVGGVFCHRTSRALDPQLHTHAVVANLARRADGAYVALDATAIFAQAKTAGYLYQAELRARLTEYLGVEWGVVRNGTAEIKGVPMAVIGQFSKRRAQIVQTMGERGAHSARSAQDAALRTRPAKANVELSRLVEEWRAVAAELGLGEAEVEALTAKIVQRPSPAGPELARLGAELAGSGGLTEKASTFDRRAVVQAMAEAHTYGATVARVEGLADRFLGSHHVLAVERQPALAAPDTLRRRDGSLLVRPTGEKYTTPEMLACEAALVAGAQRRTAEGAGTADADAVGRALAGRPTLGDDQAEMVRALTRSGDGVQVVRAPAGTGKTYALDAAREAWAGSGYRVVGATVAARAKVELAAQAGIESWTIAGLLNDFDRGYGLAAHNVLVVDEAGMVPTRQLARMVAECERSAAKLVLVGDDGQLPEIDAGGAFRGLAERLGACELTESRRLVDTAEFALQQELRAGRPQGWLEFADQGGRLVLERGHDATYARLVSDWAQGREQLAAAARVDGRQAEAVMLAPTREAAAELNARAQAYARHTGRLGAQALELGGVRYSEGDRVLCLENRERDIGVLNGHRGTVTALEPDTLSLRVEIDGHGERVLPASYIEDGHLALGYAMTVHKSQGMSADRTYVLGSEDHYRELGSPPSRATVRNAASMSTPASRPPPSSSSGSRSPAKTAPRCVSASRVRSAASAPSRWPSTSTRTTRSCASCQTPSWPSVRGASRSCWPASRPRCARQTARPPSFTVRPTASRPANSDWRPVRPSAPSSGPFNANGGPSSTGGSPATNRSWPTTGRPTESSPRGSGPARWRGKSGSSATASSSPRPPSSNRSSRPAAPARSRRRSPARPTSPPKTSSSGSGSGPRRCWNPSGGTGRPGRSRATANATSSCPALRRPPTAPNAARGNTPPRRPRRWPQTRRPPSICPTWAQSSTSSRRRLTKSKSWVSRSPVKKRRRPSASTSSE